MPASEQAAAAVTIAKIRPKWALSAVDIDPRKREKCLTRPMWANLNC